MEFFCLIIDVPRRIKKKPHKDKTTTFKDYSLHFKQMKEEEEKQIGFEGEKVKKRLPLHFKLIIIESFDNTDRI